MCECQECGSGMSGIVIRRKVKEKGYDCSRYRQFSTKACHCHEVKEKDIYSLDQLKNLLSKNNDTARHDYKVFFNLLAHCGLRRGEALGIEYKDIDFDSGILSISRTSNYNSEKGVYTSAPKTRSSYRCLYLQPNILDLIKQLREEQREQAEKIGA